MSYIINKSNGEKLAEVSAGSIDSSTDLTLVGKNYPGYGDILNQNVIYLLENFANTVPPAKPLRGQTWYDYNSRKLKIYSGNSFKSLARLESSSTIPTESAVGDLFWDTSLQQLKVFNGSTYVSSAGSSAVLQRTSEGRLIDVVAITALSNISVEYQILACYINDNIIALISDTEFTLNSSHTLYIDHNFRVVKKGITVSGSNSDTGTSTSTQHYFWGTAADSTRLNNVPASEYALISDIASYTTNVFNTLTVLTTLTTAVIQSSGNFGIFKGNWQLDSSSRLQATYADIAERYHADSVYDPGTVLVFGGECEVATTSKRADTRVAGIVSDKYAHLLNSDAGNDETHPALALAGRVPCFVIGPVEKGDLLVSSEICGYAETWKPGDDPAAVFAKAIESCSPGMAVIEVKI
jgi:hypothetical protein